METIRVVEKIPLPGKFVITKSSTKKRLEDLRRDYWIQVSVQFENSNVALERRTARYTVSGDVWVLSLEHRSPWFKVRPNENPSDVKGHDQKLVYSVFADGRSLESLSQDPAYPVRVLLSRIDAMIKPFLDSSLLASRALAAQAEKEEEEKKNDEGAPVAPGSSDEEAEVLHRELSEFVERPIPQQPAPAAAQPAPVVIDVTASDEEKDKEQQPADSEQARKQEFVRRMREAKKRKAEERARNGEPHPMTARALERKKKKEEEEERKRRERELRRERKRRQASREAANRLDAPAPAPATRVSSPPPPPRINISHPNFIPNFISNFISDRDEEDEYEQRVSEEMDRIEMERAFGVSGEDGPSSPVYRPTSPSYRPTSPSYSPSFPIYPEASYRPLHNASADRQEQDDLAAAMRLSLQEFEKAQELKNKLEEEERAIMLKSREIAEAKEKAQRELEEKKRKLPTEEELESLAKRIKAVTGSSAPAQAAPPKKECKICFEEVDDLLAFNGCGHRSVCANCKHSAMIRCKGLCIMCRKPFSNIIKIFD